MIAGVAAGHPATAAAGVEILDEGGSAADAAVAAGLASCVAETVMTGLLGGGHAIHFDAASGTTRNLDCFCAAPGLGVAPREAELVQLEVPFGSELVHYAVGPASCAVPGVPAGLGALWREHGRLPWARLVEPALRLARAGVPMPPAHVLCLEMLAPVLTLDAGARIYAPGGSLLRTGELLQQPGLVAALESLAAEGAAGAYTGTIAERLLALSDERGRSAHPPPTSSATRCAGRRRSRCRGSGCASSRGEVFPGCRRRSGVSPASARCQPAARLVSLVEALDGGRAPETHTTNLVAVDAEGDVCVLTTSLGLGSGDYVPGLDLHLNSMLGETDLLHGTLEPGGRMQSMMAPSVVLDRDGPVLAIGAAGGTRLRSALVTVAAGVLDEGLEPQAAVDRGRAHPAAGVVNAEPGVDEEGLALLEAQGRTIRRWPERHHYFGGVSLIGRSGGAADPRRSGAARAAGRAR